MTSDDLALQHIPRYHPVGSLFINHLIPEGGDVFE